ncbi:DUF397 domain-containing protein [Streptomyces griseoviridis]|uniref:DUF397 domain-containing protein n=1 Tax=Streptomyces griseoviridis TaxID=45398 RepID=A0ABT9LHF5_STRGD|nr:DUF397 domain-containing protein [Streptomyces griseoviridis]MDP9681891.1 hypothetical protein [Streptomyces griseoviridis]GGT04072.1 hypothetical protein GCM10010240_41900 [Streptomyces griseoviridis]
MDNWRESSHSGPDEGNGCVELAGIPTHMGVRDSKARDRASLTFSAPAFLPFLGHLKSPRPRTP